MTNQPTSSVPAFREFLANSRDALVQDLLQDGAAQLAFLKNVPQAELQPLLEQTINVFLTALESQELEVVKSWAQKWFDTHFTNETFSYEQAVQTIASLRQHLIAHSLLAVHEQVAEAMAGLLFLGTCCDAMVSLADQLYRTRLEAINTRLRSFEALAENAIDGVLVFNLEGIVTYVNPALVQLFGYKDRSELIGREAASLLFAPENVRMVVTETKALKSKGSNQWRMWIKRSNGTEFLAQNSSFSLTNERGRVIAEAGFLRDITAEYEDELERTKLQEEIIRVQQDTLRQISTPLIPISDQVVVLPLIGSVDSVRAQQVLETLLEGVAFHRSEIAILDITGVPVVDVQVANALIRAAQAVKLLGALVVLTGIRPDVAQTLVGLGIDLSEIVTRSTLQGGIAYAMKRR